MFKLLETPKGVALLGGALCYFLAFAVLIQIPSCMTDADEPKVVGVDGVGRDVKPYTAVEQRGRDVYGKNVCWHCHSDFVRPVNGEEYRWGPVSQAGEYAHDIPHFFGTRRTGPDLHREGGLRSDDWHLAHFYDPRYTVPRSVMPAFTWLFDGYRDAAAIHEAIGLLDTNGDGMVSSKIGDEDASRAPASLKDAVAKARVRVDSKDPFTKLDVRGVRPPAAGAVDSMWYTEGPPVGDGMLTDYDGAPRPTDDCTALLTYVQNRGTAIGGWREPAYAPTPQRTSPFEGVEPRPRRTADMRAAGFLRDDPAAVKAAEEKEAAWKAAAAAWDARHPDLARRLEDGGELYRVNCAGCHGAEGRGNGPGAQFMETRPRDLTLGKYKYKSTVVGNLPHDGDIFRTLYRGLPGTAMPYWKELSDEQLWLLVDYVKSLYEGDKSFNDKSVSVPTSPQRFDPNPEKELARGRAIWLGAQCANCHGLEGRADGTGWNTTTGEYGNLMRPRDLRPRIAAADLPELYALLGRKLERWAGREGWAKLSTASGWAKLAPKDDATTTAFHLFLLGEGPRVRAVFGDDALKAAVGDARFSKEFAKGNDPLEDLRMSAATEKDRPSLRFRGGASADDLYRTIMAGLESTPMKAQRDDFWTQPVSKLANRKDLRGPAARFEWKQKDGSDGKNDEKKLYIVTKSQALADVGVQTRKVDDKDEEFLVMQPGDDWALVHYVMWISCTPQARPGR